MRNALTLFALLLIAGCSKSENRSDGVSASEARALDNAAAKIEAEGLPPDNGVR